VRLWLGQKQLVRFSEPSQIVIEELGIDRKESTHPRVMGVVKMATQWCKSSVLLSPCCSQHYARFTRELRTLILEIVLGVVYPQMYLHGLAETGCA
jgi:hypothetical protein